MKRHLLVLVLFAIAGLFGGCAPVKHAPSPSENFSTPALIALAQAAIDDNASEVSRLIKEGADVNAVGKNGVPLLGWALLSESKGAFHAMLEAHANPRIRAPERHFPSQSLLAYALRLKDPYWVTEMVAHGAPVNQVIAPADGWTPLMLAIWYHNAAAVQVLISHGANLNARTAVGQPALMLAADGHSYDIVYQMLTAGADYTAKDRTGKALSDQLAEYASDRLALRESATWKSAQRVATWLADRGVPLPKEFALRQSVGHEGAQTDPPTQ